MRTIEKLERKIPYYDLFAEDGLDLIEEHADRILAEVGIEVWGDAGDYWVSARRIWNQPISTPSRESLRRCSPAKR